MADLKRLKTVKDVVYVASFGHGSGGAFWYNKPRGGSISVSTDNYKKKSKKTELVNVNDFAAMIDWADPNECCSDDGRAFELYHCSTNAGNDNIRGALDKAINKAGELDEHGYGEIPRQNVFVGGTVGHIQNGPPWPGKIGGFPKPDWYPQGYPYLDSDNPGKPEQNPRGHPDIRGFPGNPGN